MDAAWFGGANLALMVLYIRPKIAELRPAPELADDWMLLLLPAMIGTAIGFFVPTWYRAHAAECKAMVTPLRTGGIGLLTPDGCAR